MICLSFSWLKACKSSQAGLKGQKPLLEGQLSKPVQPEESLWSLDNSAIEMTLQKSDGMSWWSAVVEGDPAIDTSKVCLTICFVHKATWYMFIDRFLSCSIT